MNKSVDTREVMQSAAKTLFAEKGYNATTTRDIVSKSGANISAIAYHFGGKEGLFMSLFDNFLHQKEASNQDYENPVEELGVIIASIIDLRFRDPELVSILQQEIVIHSPRAEALKARLTPIWQRVRVLLEKGKVEGNFHYNSIDNALNFAMSVAIFPRHNPFFKDLVDENMPAELVKEEILSFVLKGLG